MSTAGWLGLDESLSARVPEQTVREIQRVMELDDQQALAMATVRAVLLLLRPYVDQISVNVSFPDLSAGMALRAIGKKTHDALSAIADLIEHGHAYPAIALLRPICEDLIFGKFLITIPSSDADEYVVVKGMYELLRGLRAQADFFAKAWPKYLFKSHPDPDAAATRFQMVSKRFEEAERELKGISKRLGAKGEMLSVWQMAKRADLEDEYNFFYHAASGAVHANPYHLYRMFWGDPKTGLGAIDNKPFNLEYSMFALVYGAWLTQLVMDVVMTQYPYAWPEGSDESYDLWLAMILQPTVETGFPSIVTEQEMYWPEEDYQ